MKAIDHDCNDIPDAAMTLAVAALYANGTTAIRNVYNWRVKETERMVAIVAELGKLGAQVSVSSVTKYRTKGLDLFFFVVYQSMRWGSTHVI